MNSHVIDTNVLLVASAAHDVSPFRDTHVPAPQRKAVLNWLSDFNADESRSLVLDNLFAIYKEYTNKLTDQDYGLQVVLHKMQTARYVSIDWREDAAIVPSTFDCCDRSDRMFVAAALTDPDDISIVNAADSDWLKIEEQLRLSGIEVINIIEAWLRECSAVRV